MAFVDFGTDFIVLDPTGEDPRAGEIRDISCVSLYIDPINAKRINKR
jgi:hypothetical protein